MPDNAIARGAWSAMGANRRRIHHKYASATSDTTTLVAMSLRAVVLMIAAYCRAAAAPTAEGPSTQPIATGNSRHPVEVQLATKSGVTMTIIDAVPSIRIRNPTSRRVSNITAHTSASGSALSLIVTAKTASIATVITLDADASRSNCQHRTVISSRTGISGDGDSRISHFAINCNKNAKAASAKRSANVAEPRTHRSAHTAANQRQPRNARPLATVATRDA